jgi:hypothetical protein
MMIILDQADVGQSKQWGCKAGAPHGLVKQFKAGTVKQSHFACGNCIEMGLVRSMGLPELNALDGRTEQWKHKKRNRRSDRSWSDAPGGLSSLLSSEQ